MVTNIMPCQPGFQQPLSQSIVRLADFAPLVLGDPPPGERSDAKGTKDQWPSELAGLSGPAGRDR